MLGVQPTNRPLLQRRNTLSNTFQAAYDGLIVILLILGLTLANTGIFNMQYMVMTLVLLGTMAIVYDKYNVYRYHGTLTQKALTLGKAWTISFGVLLLLAFLTKNTETYSRAIAIQLYLLGYVAQAGGHVLFRYLQQFSTSHQDVLKALIIGTGPLANHIFERINQNPWIPEQIVGAVTVGNKSPGGNKVEDDALLVLGDLKDIYRLIKEHKIDTVYIAVPLNASPIIEEVYYGLLNVNVNIHWAPNIFALNLINHSVKELAGIPILTLSESPLIGSHIMIKGIEDMLLSILALILTCPIMLLTAIAIKLESPGPVFFRQRRTGWDGREFNIWKFRSMRLHQPENGKIKQAILGDPRITRVGHFIRRTSIDELPQLFNVLAGQMSLVGPRPHALEHNDEYSQHITAYLARHRIKPGITGLAQVRGFRGETKELEQMEKRVKYDLDYINNWSLWLDISILVRTVFTLFSKNAY